MKLALDGYLPADLGLVMHKCLTDDPKTSTLYLNKEAF
jgi:hypothetical protein